MKRFRLPGIQLLLVLLLAGTMAAAGIEPGKLCSTVGQLLEQGHFSHRKMDAELSRQLFKNYVEELDYERLFFTEKDIATLKSDYAASLGRDVLAGRPEAVYKISDLYRKRVEERIAKVGELVAQPFDFQSTRTVEITREKSPWSKDEADLDRIWHDQIEADLLDEKLSAHAISPGPVIVQARYSQVLRTIQEQTRADVLDRFLFVLAQTFDPHSEYLTKDALEELESDMRLSTVGIGVGLKSDGGYVKVTDVMAGSPAQRDGRLKVNDRITAVADKNGKFVDVVGMRLDKALELIRGQKGSMVRLQVLPARPADSSERKIVEITRDDIQLKEDEASAQLIERSGAGGSRERLGWITLPSFYEDMSKKGRSATRDVRALLGRLKSENITGLVLDLRQNGGGSLDEAVNLTGLFVGKTPVVQEKDSDGKIYVSRTRDAVPFYAGPLVVLTDHLTASASEIFASAIQDLGRGVVVGDDHTFGKGTVQTVIEMKELLGKRKAKGGGAVQLTIAKFYRVAGGSTQLRGMIPDIILPSPFDLPDDGEAAMKNPLPYDEISPVSFKKAGTGALFLPELRERSAERVTRDQEFAWIGEDLDRDHARHTANRLSLNEQVRRSELAEEKARNASRFVERGKRSQPSEKVYSLKLENVRRPTLEPAKHKVRDSQQDEADELALDAVKHEALNIVGDLASRSQAEKPMQASRGDTPRGPSRRSRPAGQ